MTEVLWPPDLIPSSQTWGIADPVAAFGSPFTGATKTYGRPGTRMGCMLTFPPMKGEARARMIARVAALKGRGNRIWVPDWSTTLETGLPVRGSFAATELLTNNDFSSGTTGWTTDNATLSVTDRFARLVNSKANGAAGFQLRQSITTLTLGTAYLLRSFIANVSRSGMFNGTFIGSSNYATDAAGIISQAYVSDGTTINVYPAVFDAVGTVSIAGDYAELSYTSLARCALVDNGPNALLYSDQFDNAAWNKADCTISANVISPDGGSTGDDLIENTANALHYVSQGITVGSAAADYAVCVAIRAGNRNYAWLEINEGTGATSVVQYFNVAGGAVGASGSTGAQWSNRRAFAVPLGDSWTLCCLICRKTNAATALTVYAGAATADGTRTYTGSGLQAVTLWRATAAQSSVAVRLTQTTTAATTGTTQTSNRLYVKGLPASTQNLLKAGDMVQIGGQINYVIAPLDSNAAGLGVLICGNPWRSPADNAPVIVNTPMCKMMVVGDNLGIETSAAQFTPIQLELVEAIE